MYAKSDIYSMHIAKIRVAPSFNVFMVTLLQMTRLESLAFLERIKGVSLNLVFIWVLHVQLCTFVCVFLCVYVYMCFPSVCLRLTQL